MTKSEVFKRNVVKEIIEKLEQNQDRKIKIDLPAGCGGTSILVDVIAKRIDKEKEINVIVKSLDASCVTLETRAWVSQDAYWDTRFILFERFKQVFDENGIEIPFNQLDVTLKQ